MFGSGLIKFQIWIPGLKFCTLSLTFFHKNIELVLTVILSFLNDLHILFILCWEGQDSCGRELIVLENLVSFYVSNH